MTHLSRRQFLENSMFAAAAAAAASSHQAWADDSAQSSSPNERLSAAVIGVNGQGNSHLGSLSGRKDAEVTCICDIDQAVGEKRASEIEKSTGRRPKVVRDMREVFDDSSIDIVSIATPNHTHALAAIWAIQAGKDVYVEKPVSHNVSEGRRIVEAARKHEKICQTGTQSRSMQGMRDAIEYVHSGQIGEVRLARGLCYKPRGSIGPRGEYKVPESVGAEGYNLWLGPAPEKSLTRQKFHYDWHWQWDYGNGDLGNQGIHQMDLARWALGGNSLAKSVISYGGRFGYEDAGETANTQVCIFDYGDKTLVFEVRGLKTEAYKDAKVGVIFEGSDGYVVMTSYSGGSAFDPQGKLIKSFNAGGDHFDNFIKAIRSRKVEDLHADIQEGHLSSALCHLGNISYRLGQPLSADEVNSKLEGSDEALDTFDRFRQHLADNKVKLEDTRIQCGPRLAFNTESETFADNQDANRMLTREYRKPFVVPAAGEV